MVTGIDKYLNKEIWTPNSFLQDFGKWLSSITTSLLHSSLIFLSHSFIYSFIFLVMIR